MYKLRFNSALRTLVMATLFALSVALHMTNISFASDPTFLLSEISSQTLPTQFVLRDDTHGVSSVKFYDITVGTVYISQDKQGPTYDGTYTFSTTGVKKIQVRHFIAGVETRVDKTISVGQQVPPPSDTDGDGVTDANDQCPTVAGPASNFGCPAQAPIDTDGDGIADSSDQCPTTVGPASNNGCPVQPPVQTACIPVAIMIQGAGRNINVSTSAGLSAALADAQAGDTITLADGVYESSTKFGTSIYASFGIARSGIAEAPITITGSREAKIRGNGLGGRYGFEMYGVQHVILRGFTVFESSKGIVLDGSSNTIIDNVMVDDIGAEGVHYRAMSSKNVIKNSVISDVGLEKQNFGEGVYVGSAGDNNWKVFSCDKPDTSDNNIIENNDFVRARAESIDIKEGTTGTIVYNNRFFGDQTATPAAPFGDNSGDSWVDVKGNDSIIENNVGNNSLNHGFETHSPSAIWYRDHPEVPRTVWGARNIFRNNVANVNNQSAVANPMYTGGFGFSFVQSVSFDGTLHQLNNVLYCDNTATGAVRGLSNVSCQQ